MIDFKEIENGLEWELFAQAFFKSKGFSIIEGSSEGSDQGTGKDLIIEESVESEMGIFSRRFLVSCKHYAHSERAVLYSNENASISNNLHIEGCTGFIAFYSTWPSSTLLRNLQIIEEKDKKIIRVFDKEEIEHYLLKEDNDMLLKRYFPNSYKRWNSLKIRDAEKNVNFKKLKKEDLNAPYTDYHKQYYEGQPAIWGIIDKYTFKRKAYQLALKQLEANSICLITGAGGEGKTTLLMQLGIAYHKKGYEVLYNFESIIALEIGSLKFQKSKSYLLIIDNANKISDILNLLIFVKVSPNVKLLLGSRRNEWKHSLFSKVNRKDINRYLKNEIVLKNLDPIEFSSLSDLLVKHKIARIADQNELISFSENNSDKNFLLAVMIFATKGKSLEFIIEDVIDSIKVSGEANLSLEAIGYIVGFEVLGLGIKGPILCTEDYLKTLLDIKKNDDYRKISIELSEEALFQESVNKTIQTRNSNIADLYFKYLFCEGEIPILDIYDVYSSIISVVHLKDAANKYDVLASIPRFLALDYNQVASKLLMDLIGFGYFFNTFYSFIDKEIEKDNIGSYSEESYSARALFLNGFFKNSTNPTLYRNWAYLEIEQGNIGIDINDEYSARWIYNQGLALAPSQELIMQWADLEISNDNYGKSINDEYSARWIYNKSLDDVSKYYIVLNNWAYLEIEQGNIGIDINDEYSARWIYNEGLALAPSQELIMQWADLEISNDNYGKSVNDEYSARWIYNKSLDDVNKYYIVLSKWATFEAEKGNIGTGINDEYSARWLLYIGFKHHKSEHIVNGWAKMESEAGNYGKSIDDKYSARWIYYNGYTKHNHSEILNSWANMEVSVGNIGKDVNDEYSARWLFKNSFELNRDFPLRRWIRTEIVENNEGDENTLYSARWIYNQYQIRFNFDSKKNNYSDFKKLLEQSEKADNKH